VTSKEGGEGGEGGALGRWTGLWVRVGRSEERGGAVGHRGAGRLGW